VANGVVYVGSFDGNVYALNASTGAELWSFPTGSYVTSSPAVANGVVYVGSNNNNVYAFSLAGGQQVRRGQQVRPPVRPALSALHPDPNLKPSQPAASLPSNDYKD
jgi:outer membrane protein assembly factor BamB